MDARLLQQELWPLLRVLYRLPSTRHLILMPSTGPQAYLMGVNLCSYSVCTLPRGKVRIIFIIPQE